MSEAGGSGGGGVAVTISKGTKQPLVRVDDDLDVDSLMAEFTNLKFTIQKGSATETNIGRVHQLHKILVSIDNELTNAVPDWDTQPTHSGAVFITHMPTTKAALRTKCQPFESSTVQIKIAPHPFARGGVRASYRALVLHKGVWKEYILKMFLAPKNRTSEQYLDQLESNNVAKCLAKIFMTETSEGKRAAKIGQHISFLESRAVRVTKEDGQIVWYNMEKVIDGTFDKWTTNIGYCNARPENRTLLEFAKWTYEWTDGFMMATDLQGGKSARKGWVLTDPAMLCQDLSRFGPTNFDEAQLQMCYEGAQHALEHGLSLEDCLLGSSYAPGFSRHDDGSRFGAARGRADARARLRREKERKKREKKKKKPNGDLVAPPEEILCVSQGGRLLAEGRSLMEALEICEGLAGQGVFDRRAELVVALGSGVHEVVGSSVVPGWGTRQKTVSVPFDNLSFVGQGERETIVHGGFVVENGRKVSFEGLTVKNSSVIGLRASGAGTKMILQKVRVERCQSIGVGVYDGAKLDATECQFHQNGRFGVEVDGSTTTARLTNCTSHHNKWNGVQASSGAVVDLMGRRTSVHDNERHGLSAENCDHHQQETTINVYQPCVLIHGVDYNSKIVSHGNKRQNIFMDFGGVVQQKGSKK